MEKFGGFKDEATTEKYGSITGESKSKPGKPVLPPKIDRQKKPSKKSAAERLFGQRAQHSPPEDPKAAASAGSPGYTGSINTNSNSNSYNPHTPENYDSFSKRGSGEPGYGTSGFSRNPYAVPPGSGGQQIYQHGESGVSSLPNGLGTPGHAGMQNGHDRNGISPPQTSIPQQNGGQPQQNGMPPQQNGMSPQQNGISPPQQNGGMNGYASTGKPGGPPPNSAQDKYR